MKIYSILIVFILLINILLIQAQDTNNKNQSIVDIKTLINDDLDLYYDLIIEKSQDLSQNQKFLIYNECKKSPLIPSALNLFLGFGIGSWFQGDKDGGAIGTIGNLSGLLLYSLSKEKNYRYLGLNIFISFWLIDCIVPFSYSNKYNKKLRSVLGITRTVSLEFLPNVNVTQNGNLAPGIMFSLSF